MPDVPVPSWPVAIPRIAPVDELTAAARAALGDFADRRPLPNVFATLARHPRLAATYVPFGTYLMRGSTLPVRDRELVILRVAVRTGCAYEFLQHARIARNDVDRDELGRVVAGADRGWNAHETALLRAVDELIDDHEIAEDTWSTLSHSFDEEQLMDLVFTIGTYTLLAWALRSFGVELDPNLDRSLWPEPATTIAGARLPRRQLT